MNEDAAAGAEGQSINVLVLGKVGTDAIGIDDGIDFRIADGQAADLTGGEQIALQ